MDQPGAVLYQDYPVIVNDFESPQPHCPDGFYDWMPKSDTCHSIIFSPLADYDNAKQVCEKFYKGKLLVITSKSMEIELLKRLRGLALPSNIWIGNQKGTKKLTWVF